MNQWFRHDGSKSFWFNGTCKAEAIDKQIDAQSSNEPVFRNNEKLAQRQQTPTASCGTTWKLWLIRWFLGLMHAVSGWSVNWFTDPLPDYSWLHQTGPPTTVARKPLGHHPPTTVGGLSPWLNEAIIRWWSIDTLSLLHGCIAALTMVQWRFG